MLLQKALFHYIYIYIYIYLSIYIYIYIFFNNSKGVGPFLVSVSC